MKSSHLAALVMRVCESVLLGRGGVVGSGFAHQGRCAGAGDEKQDTACSAAAASLPSTKVHPSPSLKARGKRSTDHPRGATYLAPEKRSTHVTSVDWSAERAAQSVRRRANRTGESEDPEQEGRWAETLLECLLP